MKSLNWLANKFLNFVSKRVNETSLQYYTIQQLTYEAIYLSFLSITFVLILIGLLTHIPILYPIFSYIIVLTGYMIFSFSKKMVEIISQALEAQKIASKAFGQLGISDFDFSKVLTDPDFEKMLTEMRQNYQKNVQENDDFLKEIEKNLGGKF